MLTAPLCGSFQMICTRTMRYKDGLYDLYPMSHLRFVFNPCNIFAIEVRLLILLFKCSQFNFNFKKSRCMTRGMRKGEVIRLVELRSFDNG